MTMMGNGKTRLKCMTGSLSPSNRLGRIPPPLTPVQQPFTLNV
jgi:hypothetical protein